MLAGTVYIVLTTIANIVGIMYTQMFGTMNNVAFVIKVWGLSAFFVYIYINVYRWSCLVAKRQNKTFLDIKKLTTNESKFATAMILNLIYATFNTAWGFFFASNMELSRRNIETYMIIDVIYTLVYFTIISGKLQYIIVHTCPLNNDYSAMGMIVVSGRIIRDFAVTNMHTLRLKQIFVRHVSHEIRYVDILSVCDAIYGLWL